MNYWLYLLCTSMVYSLYCNVRIIPLRIGQSFSVGVVATSTWKMHYSLWLYLLCTSMVYSLYYNVRIIPLRIGKALVLGLLVLLHGKCNIVYTAMRGESHWELRKSLVLDWLPLLHRKCNQEISPKKSIILKALY